MFKSVWEENKGTAKQWTLNDSNFKGSAEVQRLDNKALKKFSVHLGNLASGRNLFNSFSRFIFILFV